MLVSFSFLDLDKKDIEKSFLDLEKINSKYQIHFDVMDGKFVEKKTYGALMLKEVSQITSLFKDVHLMVENPKNVIDEYIEQNPEQITVHYEACDQSEILKIIEKLRQKNIRVGLSIKPETSIEVLNKFLDKIDLVLVMSVNPGRGGQKFIKKTFKRVKKLSALKEKYNFKISVDGGVNPKNSKKLKKAGCDVIVIGSYLVDNGINKESIYKLVN